MLCIANNATIVRPDASTTRSRTVAHHCLAQLNLNRLMGQVRHHDDHHREACQSPSWALRLKPYVASHYEASSTSHAPSPTRLQAHLDGKRTSHDGVVQVPCCAVILVSNRIYGQRAMRAKRYADREPYGQRAMWAKSHTVK